MSGKRMLILPEEIIKKINENRGDLSQAEFIDFLIDSQLQGEDKRQGDITKEEIESIRKDIKAILLEKESKEKKFAKKEDIEAFQQDTRKLLKNFLDFFIGYGLELGKQSPSNELKEITSKLQGLEEDLAIEDEGGEVKIKWK
jgi:hypothetical protein